MIETLNTSFWKRSGVAFVSGALGVTALPPFGWLPLFVAALCPLVWLLDATFACADLSRKASIRRVFSLGWFWGCGYFLAGLWWLGFAFLVDADVFAWVMPISIAGFCAFLAFFPGLGMVLAWSLWSRKNTRIFAFAFAFSVMEWLRGHILTGFPWNLPGMVLGQHVPLMQVAALGGIYLMTFLVLLLFSAPATLLPIKGQSNKRFKRCYPTFMALLVFTVLAVWGGMRVPSSAVQPIMNMRFRIMQPNFPQDAQFNRYNAQAILTDYLNLSLKGEAVIPKEITHILWPETAFPFILDQEPEALNQIAHILPAETVLVTGAARMVPFLPGEDDGNYYNSIAIVDSMGTVTWPYDKMHLVPFGEYIPSFFDKLINSLGLRKFVDIPGNYDVPDKRKPVVLPYFGFVVGTICYEAIFSSDILPSSDVKKHFSPLFILNVTNDGWFGNSPGPYQHFAQSRLRAVEEGLSFVRAANTGISAVVDPYGRIIASAPLGVKTVFDSDIPVALPYKTFFARFRDIPFFVCLLFSLLIGFRGRFLPKS